MLLFARYVIPVSSPHIENGAVLVRDGRIVTETKTVRIRNASAFFMEVLFKDIIAPIGAV